MPNVPIMSIFIKAEVLTPLFSNLNKTKKNGVRNPLLWPRFLEGQILLMLRSTLFDINESCISESFGFFFFNIFFSKMRSIYVFQN